MVEEIKCASRSQPLARVPAAVRFTQYLGVFSLASAHPPTRSLGMQDGSQWRGSADAAPHNHGKRRAHPGERARNGACAPLARHDEQHDRIDLAPEPIVEPSFIALGLVSQRRQCLGAAVKLNQHVQRRAVGEAERGVGIREQHAVEGVVQPALAMPVREHAAGGLRFDGESHDELVDLHMVGELPFGLVATLTATVCCQASLARSTSLCAATMSAPPSSRIQ